MARRGRTRYHHGDARNALLEAASTLLETVGAHGLSLRRVAEHAGLSRQAPYNHFADKEALLAELVRRGYERLGREVRSVPGYPGGPTALQHAGEVYICLAQDSPALFRLMFSRELVDLSRFPETGATADAAYQALVDIVATMAGPRQRDDLSLAAWSIVHGYATLCIETGLEDLSQRQRRARLFARLIRNGCKPHPAR